jgi:hypothetical protein
MGFVRVIVVFIFSKYGKTTRLVLCFWLLCWVVVHLRCKRRQREVHKCSEERRKGINLRLCNLIVQRQSGGYRTNSSLCL